MRLRWLVFVFCSLAGTARAERTPAVEQTSEIQFEAREPGELAERVRELARELGGQLLRAEPSSLTLELPSARYAELRRRLRELGDVLREQTSVTDLDAAIADAKSAIEARRLRRERLEALEPIAIGVQESLVLQRELEAAERDLAAAEAAARALEKRGTVARVQIRHQPRSIENLVASELPFEWLDELGLARLQNPSARPAEPSYELRAFVDGEIGAFFGKFRDPERVGDASYAAGVATSLRALGEAAPVGIFGGFDLSLGYGAGFLYGAQALLGVGMPIGSRFAFGVGSGPGIDGITGGVVPFGVRFPVEIYTLLDASLLQLSAFARSGWVVAADERKDGSPHAPFGDELAAGIRLDFGSQDGWTYSRDRVGPRIGVAYRELMGTAFYELSLSFAASEIDLSESY